MVAALLSFDFGNISCVDFQNNVSCQTFLPCLPQSLEDRSLSLLRTESLNWDLFLGNDESVLGYETWEDVEYDEKRPASRYLERDFPPGSRNLNADHSGQVSEIFTLYKKV